MKPYKIIFDILFSVTGIYLFVTIQIFRNKHAENFQQISNACLRLSNWKHKIRNIKKIYSGNSRDKNYHTNKMLLTPDQEIQAYVWRQKVEILNMNFQSKVERMDPPNCRLWCAIQLCLVYHAAEWAEAGIYSFNDG